MVSNGSMGPTGLWKGIYGTDLPASAKIRKNNTPPPYILLFEKYGEVRGFNESKISENTRQFVLF